MPSRLFPLIRPVYEDEPELELASAEARNNAELNTVLERQIAFDNQVIDQLRALALSDAQIAKLESSLVEDDVQTVPPPLTLAPGQIPAPSGSAAVTRTVAQPEPEPVELQKDKEKADPGKKPDSEE